MIILISCLGLIAIGLLGVAAWIYFSQKQKDEGEAKLQYAPLITASFGLFACLLAVLLFAIYIWGFTNFSS